MVAQYTLSLGLIGFLVMLSPDSILSVDGVSVPLQVMRCPEGVALERIEQKKGLWQVRWRSWSADGMMSCLGDMTGQCDGQAGMFRCVLVDSRYYG